MNKSNGAQIARISPAYAPPQHTYPVEPTGSDDLAESRQSDPIQAIWRKRFLVGILLILGGVAGYFYNQQRKVFYQTKAKVLIKLDGTRLSTLNQAMISPTRPVPVAVEKVILESTPVLTEAIRIESLGKLSSFAGMKDKAIMGVIASRLTVTPEDEDNNSTTRVLNLAYTSASQDECQRVLKAVVEAHRQVIDETQATSAQQVVKKMQEAMEDENAKIAKMGRDLDKVRAAAGSLLDWDENGYPINKSRRYNDTLEQQRQQLDFEIAELDGQLKGVKAVIDRDDISPGEVMSVIRMIAGPDAELDGLTAYDPQKQQELTDSVRKVEDADKELKVTQMRTQLRQLEGRIERNKLVYGLKHPTVLGLESEAKQMRASLDLEIGALNRRQAAMAAAEDKRMAAARENVENPVEVLKRYRDILNARLSSMEERGKVLDTLQKEAAGREEKAATYELDARAYIRDIEREKQTYDEITGRLSEIKLFDDDQIRRVDHRESALGAIQFRDN
ncbi:MAG: hypothetical protein AAFP90_07190, partial [Planctomycetota bacterium]